MKDFRYKRGSANFVQASCELLFALSEGSSAKSDVLAKRQIGCW